MIALQIIYHFEKIILVQGTRKINNRTNFFCEFLPARSAVALINELARLTFLIMAFD